MEITPHTAHSQSFEFSLKTGDAYYNDMMRFFGDGWEARGIDDKEKFENKIKANVNYTMGFIHELIKFAKLKDIELLGIFLKIENTHSQSVVFLVSLEDYVSGKLLDFYSQIQKIEKNSRSGLYRASFSVMYKDDEFETSALDCDGFINLLS
ncbi:hypothetical protein OC25_16920 [Pedobacter kyungheensis]|uniref:Uncharacterized protein n=1 Tax=Pedobacter kyungheensis TaxID=1069985 RepID=A0A0C1FKL2_9SPHI|nr:hypothetical protein [Pedobacter kyungheensis]KIA92363.1 hypothetical protein OC25_16920 [Pedobacter kyungheensis]